MNQYPFTQEDLNRVMHMLKDKLDDCNIFTYTGVTGPHFSMRQKGRVTSSDSISMEYAVFILLPKLLGMDHIMYNANHPEHFIEQLYGLFVSTMPKGNKSNHVCLQEAKETESE